MAEKLQVTSLDLLHTKFPVSKFSIVGLETVILSYHFQKTF